ncbi:hypothetical protein HUW62_43910, partial [Myxococcus sp. AM011]|uniref:hypothetical protein n=1 Tax=Myxococcus sp. AM011 TaxID=2745200 RepID=UPI001595C0B5
MNCGAPFLKAVEREPLCTHCGAERPRPQGIPLQPGWREINPTPRPQASGRAAAIILGTAFMVCMGAGMISFLVMSAGGPEPMPARVAERPRPPPAVIF